jgi:hypothetical protein
MSGEAARRNKQWWQRDELEAELPMAEVDTMPDPWVDFVSGHDASLSDEQRFFLIGDLDQPIVPRLRSIDLELDVERDDQDSVKRSQLSQSSRPRGTAGTSTGNATGKGPGDNETPDPYGQQT